MPNVLLIGDTLRSTELRHAVPVEIGDPFHHAEIDGRRAAIVWSVEGDRITAVDPGIEIVPAETFPLDDLIRDGVDIYEMPFVQTVRKARSLGLREAIVPSSFPTGHADALRAAGIELTIDQHAFDGRRRSKSAYELEAIRAASRGAEAGMAAIVELLARSEPADDGRVVDGEPLTCELLQTAAIERFTEHGCRGDDLIVARGPQAADGHDRGSGRLQNDDVLVCDLFPRHGETAYFADMTRSYTVGEPDSEIVAWHEQTLEALELARGMCKPGVNGGDVHRAVCAYYAERGHPTQMTVPEGTVLRDGFYHGLGHGVGLDVHESPSLGKVGHELVPGDVITLEPGLYRHGFGGVRVEDTLVVTEDGVEAITDFPYDLDPVRALSAAR